MSIAKVRAYFKKQGREEDVLEFSTSSATVELAAEALNVAPARIAKTLSFKKNSGALLVVTAGDTKIDNGKFKKEFGLKAKMLTHDETLKFTGYEVGGVCPFVLPVENCQVYLDISLKRFTTVFPACGSSNSAIELTCAELEDYATPVNWVDVSKGWQGE